MSQIRDGVLKKLFGGSAGLCYFPDCQKQIIEDTEIGAVGDIAHIVAQSPGGPRCDSNFPKDKIDSFENLILLCKEHHSIVDPKTEEGKRNTEWTTERLLALKKKHEDWVASFCKTVPWVCNVGQVEYMNVPRLINLTAMQGLTLDTKEFDPTKCLYKHEFSLIHLMHRLLSVLNNITPEIHNLEKCESLKQVIDGTFCSFEGVFRTKNSSSIIKIINEEDSLKGDINKDPLIYRKYSDFKLVLSIDPKWITASTAISNFCSGSVSFAGICCIKRIDSSNRIVYASPYVIGTPKSKILDW